MQGQNHVHPLAPQASTAAPARPTRGEAHAETQDAFVVETLEEDMAGAAMETQPDSLFELWPLRFPSQPSTGKANRWQGRAVEVHLPGFTEKADSLSGRFHVPDNHPVAHKWLPMFPDGQCPLQMAVPDGLPEGTTRLAVPIFVPSSKRPSSALLDWSSSMGSTEYLQIVCVTTKDLSDYKQAWPDHIFFELPPEASALGIGASRFCIQYLASQMVVSHNAGGSRCCYVLDDSILAWKADCGLPNDPHGEFMKDFATLNEINSKRLCNVTMSSVLSHFQ
eukprot:scaffold468016_cov51-Prasinocladus_malaysianus.AAC.1